MISERDKFLPARRHFSPMAWTAFVCLFMTQHVSVFGADHVPASFPASEHPRAAGAGFWRNEGRDHNVGELRAEVMNSGGIYLSISLPHRSTCSYMADASLVFGCIRGTDTLVAPGWSFSPRASFIESSSDRRSPKYDPSAKAEQQFYTVYSDMPDPPFDMDSLLRAPEGPTGIEVHQTSYGWTGDGRKRSILVDYWIKNITDRPIQKGVIGIDLWGLISCPGASDFLPPDQDNICGLLSTVPALVPGYEDTLNLAWMADNDGDFEDGPFRRTLPSVLGVRILRAPKGGRLGFNWWASLQRPVGFGTWDIYIRWGPYGAARHGVPNGWRDWYRTMINGQIDYDQVYSSHDFSDLGWNPPPVNRDTLADIANGASTGMLLSYGQFDDVLPGDSVAFTVAFSIGDHFHRDPSNFANRFNPDNPQPYLDRLDFSDLITNARVIQWAFDTPGLDSDPNDGNGYRGEAHLFDCGDSASPLRLAGCDSVFYQGDGIADFGSPMPPPSPQFELSTKPGEAILRWNGSVTETARHTITGRRNFEGYRIYAGRGPAAKQLSLLASWDQENFVRLEYDTLSEDGWRQASYPYTIAEWQRQIGDDRFDPAEYGTRSLDKALRETYSDTLRNYMGEIVEIVARERYSCWAPHNANRDNEYQGDAAPETNLIQRVGERDTTIGGHMITYGVYEAVLTNLQPSVPLYFAVTAFDQGDYVAKLPSMESVPNENWKYGEPIYSANVVADSGIHVSVYPNPYKIMYNDAFGHRTTYYAEGYEGTPGAQFTEYDRRIHFINLPDTATITIYTLAGDLIREIHHPDKHLTTYSSSATWDLITRNAQTVTPGIYIYHVASRLGSQVGKIVIIK